jgi:ubiquinone/menaquinone biosynthesis C-methylase UbiE
MPDWNTLFLEEQHRWKTPHEAVIAFANSFGNARHARILDLGCGAGRHLVYLAKQGFDMWGMDISPTGLGYARRWLSQEALTAHVCIADMTRFCFADAAFDGLVSTYVIYHNRVEGIRQTISEITRVLKPGGRGMVTMISTRSGRCGHGTALEPGTYIPESGEDMGEIHHYSDLAEIGREFSGLIVRKVELSEQDDGSRFHSHWLVFFEKPKN